MILEAAILNIKAGHLDDFEAAFKEAQKIISNMEGYLSHQLQKCVETPDRYLLLVHWETLQAHTVGFRESSQYQIWRRLLHDFYQPFPEVEHYALIKNCSS